MFAAQLFTTVLAFLAVGVQASPLSPRDVIVPKITNPTAGSVWPVGTVQTVTWDTSNFPPDSQITNPIGQVILGFDENDSLNLDFAHPLAKNFKLRDGSVKITVPNVPPRTDYLIVLIGDSGNTSPQFAITTISAPGSGASTLDLAVTTSTLITTPIPITGSVITGGTSTDTPSTATDSTTAPLPTSTTPLSSSSPSSSSISSSAASSSASSASSTSGAMSLYAPERLSFKALSLCMASMIMLIMV